MNMILSELREFPLCATRIFEARRVGAEPGERDALARLAASAGSVINQPQRSWTAIDDGCTAEAYQQGTCSIVL